MGELTGVINESVPNIIVRDQVGVLREAIKDVKSRVWELRTYEVDNVFVTPADKNEVIANTILAIRDLESARMRLGLVLQALDGNESIYDKPNVVE